MSDEVTEFPTKLNPLAADARVEAGEKRAARRLFERVLGPFARAMEQAMEAYRKARAEGVEREDAIKGLEETIRGSWEKPVTKFGPQCLVCDDIGYEEFVCRQWARCSRLAPKDCDRKGPEFQHTYVVPCQCEKGDKFRAKAYQPEQSTVGKVSKPRKGFTRMGQ